MSQLCLVSRCNDEGPQSSPALVSHEDTVCYEWQSVITTRTVTFTGVTREMRAEPFTPV